MDIDCVVAHESKILLLNFNKMKENLLSSHRHTVRWLMLRVSEFTGVTGLARVVWQSRSPLHE